MPAKDLDEYRRQVGRAVMLKAVNNPIPFRDAQDTGPSLTEILAPRRFDIANPPPAAVAIYSLGEATIATAGNLVAIQAQAKAGKTAFTGALIAATMNPSGDCLGVSSANPDSRAVIHFDTEQAPADHHAVIVRVLRRAGRDKPPLWLRSYRLADVPLLRRSEALPFELERGAQEHGGLHSVVLDGLGDFSRDPNDAGEAFALIDELHQLAIRYCTVIICILHENPGTETAKTRGHLGSQLERKAETNIRLAKDGDGVTVVFADKARHAHIPRDRGPRFAWDDEQKMHVSVATAAQTKGEAKRSELQELAIVIFRDVPEAVGLSWTKVHEAIERVERIKREGARRRFKELFSAGVIGKRGDNRYRLSKS